MKTNIVKSAVTAIAAAAFVWLGTAPMAEARHRHSSRSSCETRVYVSGHCHCGLPLYTERYVAGYDCHGRPVYGYRQVNRHTHHVVQAQPCRPAVYAPIRPMPYPYGSGRIVIQGGYCR